MRGILGSRDTCFVVFQYSASGGGVYYFRCSMQNGNGSAAHWNTVPLYSRCLLTRVMYGHLALGRDTGFSLHRPKVTSNIVLLFPTPLKILLYFYTCHCIRRWSL